MIVEGKGTSMEWWRSFAGGGMKGVSLEGPLETVLREPQKPIAVRLATMLSNCSSI